NLLSAGEYKYSAVKPTPDCHADIFLEFYSKFINSRVYFNLKFKGGVPSLWAFYLFHVKMTIMFFPGSWSTLGQKLRSLLQNEGKDMLFTLIDRNFDKFCSFFSIA